MTAAVMLGIGAFAAAAIIVIYALRLLAIEREAFGLERIGHLERVERVHSSTAALVDEHGEIISTMLKQQHEERSILIAEHRSDMRELLNRVQHPHLIPTATARVSPPPRPENASEKARAAWTGIGRVAAPAPTPPTDEVGDDIP